MSELVIEPLEVSAFGDVWPVLEPIIRAGNVFAFDTDMTESDARSAWHPPGSHVYAARIGGETVGTAYLRANAAGGGGHVANAGYAVAPAARGHGVARAMCEHTLDEARRLGFRAMQFNFVVSTNEAAVHLWRSLGFEIVGTLPGAFAHPTQGYVDAHVMFRDL